MRPIERTVARRLFLRLPNPLMAMALAVLALATLGSAQDQFSRCADPREPGERRATAIIDLRGVPVAKAKVSVVYSDNETDVANAFDPRLRQPSRYKEEPAKIRDLHNGSVACSFIFPHRDRPEAGGKIYQHPSRVSYAWAFTYTPAGASSSLTLHSPVRSFVMPRLLIIAYIGDSYASGEGAPNSGNPKWLDEGCHRSAKSGGELAIAKVKKDHPEWAIRYCNVTCSGATIAELLNEPQTRSRDQNITRPGQLVQVKNWLDESNRSIVDILLGDGGGNTAGFGPAGEAILMPFHEKIVGDENLESTLEAGLSTLPLGYDALSMALASQNPFQVGRVVWVNYPSPLTGPTGALCGPQTDSGAESLIDCWGVLERDITANEIAYIKANLFVPLNAEVRAGVERANDLGGPRWDLVDVSSAASTHGICNCREPYFNTLGASLAVQGDIFGTMHPNATGFRMIFRDAIAKQLVTSIEKWHHELHEDAKERAIEIAKAKAKAKITAREKLKLLTEKLNNIRQLRPPLKKLPPDVLKPGLMPRKLPPEDVKPMPSLPPDRADS
jgi:hypothetical protein